MFRLHLLNLLLQFLVALLFVLDFLLVSQLELLDFLLVLRLLLFKLPEQLGVLFFRFLDERVLHLTVALHGGVELFIDLLNLLLEHLLEFLSFDSDRLL
jgi:hypothetical protein